MAPACHFIVRYAGPMDSGSGFGRLIRALGLLFYGMLGAIPYMASGLVVPPFGVAILLICWVLGLVVAIRESKRWPWAAPIAAGAALLFWVLFVQLGSWILGWSA